MIRPSRLDAAPSCEDRRSAPDPAGSVAGLAGRYEALADLHHAVSHEIRNALFTAREFVALTLEDSTLLSRADRKNLVIALEACDRMKRSIEDLVDGTRIETGQVAVQLEPTLIEPVVRLAVDVIAHRAHKLGIGAVCAIDAPLPMVAIDAPRISQVMANLLGNALKFTPRGGVIHVHAARDDGGADRIVVRVRNSGATIAPTDQVRIFEPYYQAPGRRGRHAGLGLGLTISREIVRLHGGDLRVSSDAHAGTTFAFTLAAVTASPPAKTGGPGRATPAGQTRKKNAGARPR